MTRRPYSSYECQVCGAAVPEFGICHVPRREWLGPDGPPPTECEQLKWRNDELVKKEAQTRHDAQRELYRREVEQLEALERALPKV